MKVSIVLRPIFKMEPQDKILKTALSLFFKYGIKHVTMDDIARELGMSKKTIYQFFREKDDLVNQLVETELSNQECEFDTLNKAATDPIHEIILISHKMRTMMQTINPNFFLDLQKFYPVAFHRFQKFKSECAYRNVLDNINRGIAMGVYRKDLDPEFVAMYRMGQLDALMFGDSFTFERISFARTHDLMLDMFMYAISTIKGHKLINQYKKIQEEE
jgi:TetR/AcrR family transcriptional regulator, cholesterol catabolism regulator